MFNNAKLRGTATGTNWVVQAILFLKITAVAVAAHLHRSNLVLHDAYNTYLEPVALPL